MSDNQKIANIFTNYNLRKITTENARKQVERVVAQARIEEIEDISQSRDVEVDPSGVAWCITCQMEIEHIDDDCACIRIYNRRRNRLAQLRDGVLV